MKLNTLIFFFFVLKICAQTSNQIYPQQVGDIQFDKKIDDKNFKICDSTHIFQYYNFGKGFQYKGEKYEIIKTFKEKYHPIINSKKGETGYITIRFIVNCEGKTGMFRVEEMDSNYQTTVFNAIIKNQLLDITKSLDGWPINMYKDKIHAYYQYLTFKLEDSKLIEILP